jgi:hypothetical protein
VRDRIGGHKFPLFELRMTHKSRLLPLPSFREGGWGDRTNEALPPPLFLSPSARPARRGGNTHHRPPHPPQRAERAPGGVRRARGDPSLSYPPRPFPTRKGGLKDVGNAKSSKRGKTSQHPRLKCPAPVRPHRRARIGYAPPPVRRTRGGQAAAPGHRSCPRNGTGTSCAGPSPASHAIR